MLQVGAAAAMQGDRRVKEEAARTVCRNHVHTRPNNASDAKAWNCSSPNAPPLIKKIKKAMLEKKEAVVEAIALSLWLWLVLPSRGGRLWSDVPKNLP